MGLHVIEFFSLNAPQREPVSCRSFRSILDIKILVVMVGGMEQEAFSDVMIKV